MGATNPLDTEVRHVGAAGEAVTTSLRQLDLSGSPPALSVRRLKSHARQRHYSGLFWSATTSGHLPYESRLQAGSAVAGRLRRRRALDRRPADVVHRIGRGSPTAARVRPPVARHGVRRGLGGPLARRARGWVRPRPADCAVTSVAVRCAKGCARGQRRPGQARSSLREAWRNAHSSVCRGTHHLLLRHPGPASPRLGGPRCRAGGTRCSGSTGLGAAGSWCSGPGAPGPGRGGRSGRSGLVRAG